MPRLFVYGSLMRGQRNHEVLPEGATFIGRATIAGRLYSVAGSFPALVDASHLRVLGEVWSVPDFDATDQLEGYHADEPDRSHYVRQPVRAWLFQVERFCDAEAYFYNRPIDCLPPVPDGDWARFVIRHAR